MSTIVKCPFCGNQNVENEYGDTQCGFCEKIIPITILGRKEYESLEEFVKKVHTEIHEALENNYKTRAERVEKHNVGETDEFISYCQGKIDALRGMDHFIDNLYEKMVDRTSEF